MKTTRMKAIVKTAVCIYLLTMLFVKLVMFVCGYNSFWMMIEITTAIFIVCVIRMIAPKKPYVCTSCGTRVDSVVLSPTICGECRKKTMIPGDTPIGRKLLTENSLVVDAPKTIVEPIGKAGEYTQAIRSLHTLYKEGAMSQGNYQSALWGLLDKIDRKV